MNQHSAITAQVDTETLGLVDQLAIARGISSAEYAAEAIRRVAETETDLAAFLKKGADAIARGDVVPHEQVMAELDSMIEKHRARCRE